MQDAQQAEYLEEIGELQRKLVELQENEAAPALLDEYGTEIRILVALLEAARQVRERLVIEPELAAQLSARGFQPALFRDIYAFVYEAALEIEFEGTDFAHAVERTDFPALLRN